MSIEVEKTVSLNTDGDLLKQMGTDGSKWAAEFRKTALKLGYSDMDEGWLIGWMANAIEAGKDSVRCKKLEWKYGLGVDAVWTAKTCLGVYKVVDLGPNWTHDRFVLRFAYHIGWARLGTYPNEADALEAAQQDCDTKISEMISR